MKLLDELYGEILSIIPTAELGEDSDGQLVIYTNLTIHIPETAAEGDKHLPANQYVVEMDN